MNSKENPPPWQDAKAAAKRRTQHSAWRGWRYRNGRGGAEEHE